MGRRKAVEALDESTKTLLLTKLQLVQECRHNYRFSPYLKNMYTDLAAQFHCSEANISLVARGINLNPEIINALYVYVTLHTGFSNPPVSAADQSLEQSKSFSPVDNFNSRVMKIKLTQSAFFSDVIALQERLRSLFSLLDNIEKDWTHIDMLLADPDIAESLSEPDYFRAGNGEQIGRIHLPPAIREALTTLINWKPRLTTAADFNAAMYGEFLPE